MSFIGTQQRVARTVASEDPGDMAEAHHKFQAAIAQIVSLYDLYSEWPGFESRYEALAAECDNATINEKCRRTVEDIVSDDLADLADARVRGAAEYRSEMRGAA